MDFEFVLASGVLKKGGIEIECMTQNSSYTVEKNSPIYEEVSHHFIIQVVFPRRIVATLTFLNRLKTQDKDLD